MIQTAPFGDHLPTQSGLDLARQIKADHPEIIIVILTSCDSPEYQIAADESGVEHLVPKDDWTGEDMIELVQSILSDLNIDAAGQPTPKTAAWAFLISRKLKIFEYSNR